MPAQKIIKAGNSLAITVPSEIVKTFGLKPGDIVEVLRDFKDPQLLVKFSGSHQLSLVSGLSPVPKGD